MLFIRRPLPFFPSSLAPALFNPHFSVLQTTNHPCAKPFKSTIGHRVDGSEVSWRSGFTEKWIDLLDTNLTCSLEAFFECDEGNASATLVNQRQIQRSKELLMHGLDAFMNSTNRGETHQHKVSQEALRSVFARIEHFVESMDNGCILGIAQPLLEIMMAPFDYYRVHAELRGRDDSFFALLVGQHHSFDIYRRSTESRKSATNRKLLTANSSRAGLCFQYVRSAKNTYNSSPAPIALLFGSPVLFMI